MCVCKTQLVEQYICLYAMKKIILSVFEFILNTSIRIEDKLNRKCLSTCVEWDMRPASRLLGYLMK